MSEAAPIRMSVPQAEQRFNLREMRVLIADDNPQALEILFQVLRGFRVPSAVQCRSVQEALPVLAEETFDLVIIDGEMPEFDGFDLTHHLRANPHGPNFTAPIIIVSALTPRQKVERARDAGANLVITKPIVPGVLLEKIEWLARNHRQFVSSDSYSGPDRRFHNQPLPSDIPERRAEAIQLMAIPERAMSQNEIDSIFP